jgi:hypothetical protein
MTPRKIFKYPFPVSDLVRLQMPEGARILSVQVQRESPCLWALIDPDAQIVWRNFRVFGTGHPLPPSFVGEFLGTFQLRGGDLVFHLFAEDEEVPS